MILIYIEGVFDLLALYITERYRKVPILQTWPVLWQHKHTFFGFFSYGALTMGLIGVCCTFALFAICYSLFAFPLFRFSLFAFPVFLPFIHFSFSQCGWHSWYLGLHIAILLMCAHVLGCMTVQHT